MSGFLRFAPLFRQQMPRQEPGVGDCRGDHRAADHSRDEVRVLVLIDDAVVQAEQRRNRTESESSSHHQ